MSEDRNCESIVTESLCPTCLKKVPAWLITEGSTVVLDGRCPGHGAWRTPVWRGSPSMAEWCGDDSAEVSGMGGEHCPGECGLCSQHGQKTCTAVLEVTPRCDLACPVCFAESSATVSDPDPSAAVLEESLRGLFAAQGPVNVQLSGGEPTMREDLAELVETARDIGFTFVQLNTNGLRIAAEAGYAEELSGAGLSSVFLQFDGLRDRTYLALRGRPLSEHKLQAVRRCAEAGLSVVLVPTVVPGVNDGELGELVRFAASWPGVVRGLHLQPVSYFGRQREGRRPRMTLPEVLRALEAQTGGDVTAGDFRPSSCEHTRCSFRARYWVREGGRLELLRAESSCCSPESSQPGEAARRAIAATSRLWGGRPGRPAPDRGGCVAAPEPESPEETGCSCGSLDRFLEDADKVLAISGMLFQDAWSIDLARVRRCCVHSLVPGRGLVPFCLWNLTSESGARLYPRL